MAGGVEQRDQAQKSEERAAEQVRLVFFRAVVGTTFFTDDEKGNDQDEEIADADLLHRWNFAAHTDNDLHGGESADRIIKRMPFCFCVIFMMSSCEIVIEE